MATIIENISQSADGVQTLKSQLAAALRSKGVNPADKKLKDYPALVRSIEQRQEPEGDKIDLSFVTAKSADILEGKIGADVNGNPVYGSLIQKIQEGVSFYKCTAVFGEDGDNILVSGATEAGANGIYILEDKTAVGFDRVWSKKNQNEEQKYMIHATNTFQFMAWVLSRGSSPSDDTWLYETKHTVEDIVQPWLGEWVANDSAYGNPPTLTYTTSSTTPDCVVCWGVWARGLELHLVDDTPGSRIWQNGAYKIVQNYSSDIMWAALYNDQVVCQGTYIDGYEQYWQYPWEAFGSPYANSDSLYIRPAALPATNPKLWSGYKATLKARTVTEEVNSRLKVTNSGGDVLFYDIVTPGGSNSTGLYWRSPMEFNLVHLELEGLNRAFYGNDEWTIFREGEHWTIHRNKKYGQYDSTSTLGYIYNSEPTGTLDTHTLEVWADYNNGTLTCEWSGKTEVEKVVYYWEFEEIVTDNLTWGKGFTPQVGRIYNDEATVIVSSLFNTGQYDENETVVAVQKNSLSGDYTAVGFFISTGAQCIIDWGDGIVETINPGSNIEVSHNYGAAIEREHIIRIKGDVVHSIQVDGRGSLSSRLITHLIQLGNSLTSMYKMFYSCEGLTSIDDTVQIPDGVTSMREAFDGCNNLSYAPATLRMPANCTDYVYAFYIPGLHTDMTHWFDKLADTPAGTKINMYYSFGGFLQNGVSGVTGTLPADLLWNNPNITWISTNYSFYGRTSLSNYDEIPASWK